MAHRSYTTYMTFIKDPQGFCNLLITLCSKEGYMLDRLLAVTEQKFILEGGFRENLFKKRLEYRQKRSII